MLSAVIFEFCRIFVFQGCCNTHRPFSFTPFSQISFELAEYTANVDGVGTLRLLDAIKTCGLTNSVKFYQASTSELFGKVQEIPQKETTPFYPRSPYGNAHCCIISCSRKRAILGLFFLAKFDRHCIRVFKQSAFSWRVCVNICIFDRVCV